MKVYFKDSSVINGKSYGKGCHDLPDTEAKRLKGVRGIIFETPKKVVKPKEVVTPKKKK